MARYRDCLRTRIELERLLKQQGGDNGKWRRKRKVSKRFEI